ncbi:MAG TPA: glucose-6-phosphate dehydrogenase assembly protein OpcA [Gaiellaceae bacterium]|nr:glucose-6-phosphate dehydrogenase assembly protein OpcA [Gaiellaceae bacterium]
MASVAHVEGWSSESATIAQIEEALLELRFHSGHGGLPDLRTNVLTHMAWVPEEWQRAATETLAGLGERHPSRTLLLFPRTSAEDRLEARVSLECHELEGEARHLCNEIVELGFCGIRAEAPASIVEPLLLPNLPVFLRWRGRPPFRTAPFQQLVELTDRLIVDSAEWPDLPGAYAELEESFQVTAVSDIAWRRTLAWRAVLAEAWPDLPDRIAGPPAEASLIAGWLKSRAGLEVGVEWVDELPSTDGKSASDLLSEELDAFGRDPIYEDAVRAAGASA